MDYPIDLENDFITIDGRVVYDLSFVEVDYIISAINHYLDNNPHEYFTRLSERVNLNHRALVREIIHINTQWKKFNSVN